MTASTGLHILAGCDPFKDQHPSGR